MADTTNDKNEKNISVAAGRLSVKETVSTELTDEEEKYWEKMTKKRLKEEGVARRKNIGLIVMFIIMCIICVILLYCYDQHLWIFYNPYSGK